MPERTRNKPSTADGGAALIEYVLLVALIAMAGVVAIQKGGEGIKGKAELIQSRMTVASSDICDPNDPNYDPYADC